MLRLAEYNIQSVQKALKILKIFLDTDKDALTLTEMSLEIGLSKGSTLRLLYTLQNEGFVSYDPDTKKYSIGLVVLRLGMSKYDKLDWRETAAKYLKELSDENGLICYLSIRDEYNLVYLEKVFPKGMPAWAQMMARPGGVSPLHSTGMGRLFLSFFSDEELENYFANTTREKITEKTIVEKDELMAAIAMARSQGIAINDCENEDYIASICAPVLNSKGEMVAGISISGLRELILGKDKERLEQQIVSVAKRISCEFGSFLK